MSAVDKLVALSGDVPETADPDASLLLAVQLAARELALLLASGDDAEDKGDGGSDEGHEGHATYKALIKRNVPAERAAAMCARSDKKVKATALAQSLEVMLSGDPGRDIGLVTLTPPSETASGRREAAAEGDSLPDGSYAIKSKRQLHSAAVLAASRHGNWRAAQSLIKRMAGKFGVDVSSLPGFGSRSDDGEKVAATMLELAKRDAGDGGVAMNHGPFTGTHTHSHWVSQTHAHPHQHAGDNRHDGGPLHRPGSKPGGRSEGW